MRLFPVLLALALAGCNFADVLTFAKADPLGYPNWQVGAAVLWLSLTAALKAAKGTRANEPLELLANLLVKVPLVGKVVQPWTTPGTVERTAGAPPLSLLLVLAFVALPSCGHAAQAAGGTFATIAAAEHAYTKWSVSEIDRITAQAKKDCTGVPDVAACVEQAAGATFTTFDRIEAARDTYHAAQRAAARCLKAGGEPLACTSAVAGEGGKLIDKLNTVGFKVLP